MATTQPLIYDAATGRPKRITAPDTIDPTYLPPTTGTTQRTFAFFAG